MKRLTGALLLALLAGCATLADVVRDKDQGTARIYPVTFGQVWNIAKAVFRCEGADAIEVHRDEGYMLTSSGINLVSPGTVMGAWIEPTPDGQMKVTVVTERRITVSPFTTLRETTFHRHFAQAVEIVKAASPFRSRPRGDPRGQKPWPTPERPRPGLGYAKRRPQLAGGAASAARTPCGAIARRSSWRDRRKGRNRGARGAPNGGC